LIEGQTPVLREKDILTATTANTPAKRVYLALQLMYTARDPRQHHEIYFSLLADMLRAAPSTAECFATINNLILTGNLYKALKEAKKLIAYEERLIEHAKRSANLRHHREADCKSA
jgi:flagellar protein FlbT